MKEQASGICQTWLAPYWPQLSSCLSFQTRTRAHFMKGKGPLLSKLPRATAMRPLSRRGKRIRVWKHILFIQDPHFPSKTRTAFKVEKTLQNFTDTFYFAGERQTVGLQQAGCRPGSLPHPFNPPQVCPAASAKTDRRWCPFVQGVSQLWLPGLPLSIHSATESLTKMQTHVHVPSSPHIEL